MTRSRRRRGVAATVLASGLVLSACGGGATPDETAANTTVQDAGETAEGTAAETTGDTNAPAADSGSVESALLQGEFTTLSGETIDLGSLQGQDVVFWFWAPW